MAKKYDVVACTGTYKEQNGQDKTIFKNVGSVFEKNGKFYLKLDHLVTVDNDGKTINFFSLFPPRQKNQQQAQQQNNQQHMGAGQNQACGNHDPNDDIPF